MLLHLLWIIFLIFGAFLGVRNRVVRILHIAGLAFAVVLNVFGWYCPLTHIELWAKLRHDPSLAYTGSFIIHYAEELIYVNLPHSSLLVLAILLCGINAWYYLSKSAVWKRRRS
ncbi:MAG: DUF2784 domain-containing protein [Deltaproteobacteria bacterium]|nr:DUF2784 domain-containing protein [Deltaproteobacteria bacterium]